MQVYCVFTFDIPRLPKDPGLKGRYCVHMNTNIATELLINATRVSKDRMIRTEDVYEFVLNESLQIIECVHVESLAEGIIYPVNDFCVTLPQVLFELNHVRVNPRLDNAHIIHCLTTALQEIGVQVNNVPNQNSMAVCYKPLGEITENVRFYFNETGACVFLCPRARLKVVSPDAQINQEQNNPRPFRP